MNDKSHVSLEQHLCLVCGQAIDTGNLLLDRRLRASMARHTTTGWGLCEAHRKLADEGFVALIECDPQRSGPLASEETLRPERAWRTGRVAHIRRTVWSDVFNVPCPPSQVCAFVEPGVIDRLASMVVPPAD